MHDKSQVQNPGNRRDVTIVDDSGERPEYRCRQCDITFKSIKWLFKHEVKCDGIKKQRQGEISGKEGIDWVQCQECDFKGRSLGKHISSAHGINVEEYKKKHLGFLIKCHDTTLKYTEQNRINCDWIKRKKENGDDLSEYRSKMGNAVRNSIMSNPVERARRSYQLGLNNQTPAARELSRITAIKTSARPDIIAARTKRLQNSYKPSRPESCLMTLLKPYGFTRNCFISDTTFHNGSHRRQVDFVNHNRKIFIEFDGQHHFTSSWKRLALESIQKNDVALDKWVLNNHYTLIRVGWKQFHSRKNELTESCRLALVNLLNQPTLEGVWLIGNEYIQQSHPSASLTGVNNYQLTS